MSVVSNNMKMVLGSLYTEMQFEQEAFVYVLWTCGKEDMDIFF